MGHKASAGLAACTLFAEPLKSATPEPSAVTPDLVAAARKEGKVAFYTALELPTAERFGKVFEAKYPGITVRVERSGAERIFQRIAQPIYPSATAISLSTSARPSQVITLTTEGKVPPKRSYWLRVGARTTYGLKQYNYTDIKKVTLP